jgi:hypothetical protein
MPGTERTEQAASKLAQLLGETIIHHAPVTAKIDAEARMDALEGFLEGLESHTQKQVGPFLQWVKDNADLPPEIAHILDEAIDPPAQFSAFLEQIFLYGIVSNVISTSLGPFILGVSEQLSATALAAGIARPVDSSVIATAVARGLELGSPPTVAVPAWAYTEAAKSQISADDLNLQASIVGLPPALQELFELFRRGKVTIDEVKTGLKEGDFRDDWVDIIVGLIYTWPSPLDFVRAAVQAQLPYGVASSWANKTGLDTDTPVGLDVGSSEATDDMFGLLFSIAGRPPGPEELARAANRGLIPWDGTGADALTFQQGIAESDVKTKWTDMLQKLAVYVPPPRAIGTLIEHGVITEETGEGYYTASGVPEELAKAYVEMAVQQSTIQDKLLGKGEIITAYYDRLINNAQATELLGELGYNGTVAATVLGIADFRREIQAINSVVRRVGTLYENFKISATNAKTSLTSAGLDAGQADSLLQTWEILRIAPIRVPTTEEIALAVKYGTLTSDEALLALFDLGYDQRDAQIVLSAHGEVKVAPLAPVGPSVTG